MFYVKWQRGSVWTLHTKRVELIDTPEDELRDGVIRVRAPALNQPCVAGLLGKFGPIEIVSVGRVIRVREPSRKWSDLYSCPFQDAAPELTS